MQGEEEGGKGGLEIPTQLGVYITYLSWVY